MRLSVAATLAACSTSAQAFTDSSPFLMFSTSKFPELSQSQLQTSSSVLDSAKKILSSCPSSRYLVITQPNLNAGHLRSSDAAPKLRQALESTKIDGRFSVAEVAGSLDIKELTSYIEKACQGHNPSVDQVVLETIPTSGVSTMTVQENDDDLGIVLDQYDMEDSYTVIYTSGPRSEALAGEPKIYEAGFQDTVHMELKRHLQQVARNASPINSTTNLPLFEKYQFFTPGIFMGLVAIVVLFSILGVGVKALSSLEVSYGAFDKDVGPVAQKKQQ
ncbi:BIG/ATPase V1 complex, subunit S1 [Pseudomassariella vexata]|uniref:Protein BIG1 n=1 Tax=Pseudomassariella vexata TaxID=1141098 RepID=A0A1Y2EKD2_9PEZI|nr:BIG/ATPase V1 complex, subunit S1 [Pseudomassariella vexata]ORY72013.1 BIG/ATPase V1 complex, subunit S1 [Pseudomassariella vexata]